MRRLKPVLGIGVACVAVSTGTAPAAQEPQLRTPIPLLTEADRQAARPSVDPHMHMGDEAVYAYTLLNRLEAWDADPGTGLAWEAEGWIGGDIDRFWWRSEGERVNGRTEAANLEAFFGRSFTPWWDWIAGVRHDFRPGESRDFAAFGLRGLAPQKFGLALTGYFGTGSRTALRFEAEYNLLFTNRLVLQPLVDVNLYGRNDPARGIGSGLSTVEAGLRLRYEITRRVAPYVGVVRERAFGNTADLRRADLEAVDDTRLVAGFRVWF